MPIRLTALAGLWLFSGTVVSMVLGNQPSAAAEAIGQGLGWERIYAQFDPPRFNGLVTRADPA